ncbi:Uncharacterised protein [Serratia liquefaciens]|nr:Uncharacterised protein [Serratia liquefaciens]
MMYYRGGAEISPEAMKALILCSDGQSLGVPSDAGNRPNPNTWNKVNYDPKWRAYALAIAGGKPEGSQDTPITEAMLDLLPIWFTRFTARGNSCRLSMRCCIRMKMLT